MYVCLSVCLLAYLKNHTSKLHEISVRAIGAVALSSDDNGICYVGPISGFVNDVMFSRNGHYGVWDWQYLRERCAGASSHKFPTFSPGCVTVFDFVVYNGSKLRTWGVTDDDMPGAAATGLCPAACGIIKAGGEVCFYDCQETCSTEPGEMFVYPLSVARMQRCRRRW